jgi:hypothetical protein
MRRSVALLGHRNLWEFRTTGSGNGFLSRSNVNICIELHCAPRRAHTFVIDLFTNTTYPGIFDGSVATIDVEKGVVADDDSSTKKHEASETSTHSPRRRSSATSSGPIGHPLELLPGFLWVGHVCGFEGGVSWMRDEVLRG